MHPIARILAIAYVALAVLAALVYVVATANYVAVTDVQVRLGDSVRVSGVALNWTGNRSDVAKVVVSMEVTNPGRVPIKVLNGAFLLYMEDPNASDTRPWYDAGRLSESFVGAGSFNVGLQDAPTVAPRETRTFVAVVTVEPGNPRMDTLDRPDAKGRFHPIVWGPSLVYAFLDFPIQDIVYMAPYFDAAGVFPSGP